MSKKIITIGYEKEIPEDEYNNLFNSLKTTDDINILLEFKDQIINSNIKCKKCKTSVKDILYTNMTVCPCCFETIYKIIEKEKLKPSLIYSNFLNRILNNDFKKYKGKVPEYTKDFYDNSIKILDLKRELEYCIEIEDFLKCNVLKNAIEELEKKNLKLRREINE
ncbi:hypothetical protein ACLGL2_02120 [Parvimonas sp. G1641]|uniref:hypothetical protein n=1 Tax=Parvimonas sp. G1641 TaxID=3388846 RepID=UPI003980131E